MRRGGDFRDAGAVGRSTRRNAGAALGSRALRGKIRSARKSALEIRATNRKTADGGNAYNGLSIEHQKTKAEGKIWQTNSPPWQRFAKWG